jgi:hypothetical protein
VARLGGHREAAERWVREFKLSPADQDAAMKLAPGGGQAEIIVLYENGISPRKRPNPSFHSVPEFFPRYNPIVTADVEVDGQPAGRPVVFHDIEATAIENLKEKYAGIIAKKIAGAVVKEVVANQVEERTQSRALGALTELLLFAADQADVRSWNLLPHDLQILRIPVTPGQKTVRLKPVGAAESTVMEKTVQVAAGKKVFVCFRYMP